MTVRTTADQATTLLERSVAQARVRGAPSSDVEATAIFESIALNLLLKPRASLLFALLAKNALRNATQLELDTLTSLKAALDDLNNPSFSVTDTSALNDASNALLQLEQLSRVSTSSVQYMKFDSSLTSFLNSISKGVKKPGSTSLVRPGIEASQDLVTAFTDLLIKHTDVLERLYAVTVGVENFLSSPLSTIVGLTTASRVRTDLDNLINTIESTGSSPADRDMVVRLITDRATIKTMGALPSLNDPVVDTLQSLPTGYALLGASDPISAVALTNSGPFTLPAAAQVTMQVGATIIGPVGFPQTDLDLNNRTFIVGTNSASFPITIPANYYLFIYIDDVAYKFGPFTPGLTSLATFLTDANAFFVAGGPPASNLDLREFVQPGTSRLILSHLSGTNIQFSPVYVDPALGVFTNSLHTMIGFTGTEIGVSGTTPIQPMVDALNTNFSSIVTVTVQSDQQFKTTSVSTVPGVTLIISAPAVLGISGDHPATSDSFRLFGTVNGIQTDPVSPIGLMDIGDVATLPTGTGTITALSDTRVTLSGPITTFSGDIHVESKLAIVYNAFKALLDPFISSWLKGKFSKNMDALGLALSSLGQGNLQSQKNIALEFINTLNTDLSSLLVVLDDPTATLPSTAAQSERQIVDGIISTLIERKFDKALALFMKCQIQEALNSTGDTASFGGAFLKAVSDFARTDMIVPNRALDEAVEGTSTQPTKGL